MKTIILFFILSIACAQVAYAQPDPIGDYKKASIAYIMKGDGDSAVYAATQLLRLNNTEPFHHYVASNAYRTQHQNYENSCRASSTNCDQVETAKTRSLYHVSQADSLLRSSKPDSTFYLNAKASKYEEFDDFASALKVFEQSLSIKADQKDVYQHLISQFITLERVQEAVDYFSRMVKLPGITREHILHYIDILIKYNFYKEATAALDTYQPRYPEDLTFHYERLRVSLALEDIAAANKSCAYILPKRETDTVSRNEIPEGELYFLCGEARYRAKQLPDAIELYNRSLPFDTTGFFSTRLSHVFEENPALYYEKYATEKAAAEKFALASKPVNDFENQVSNIRQILSVHGNDLTPTLMDSLGGLYAGIGDFMNARNIYITLLRTYPEVMYKVKLAIVLYRLKDLDESEFYIDQVLNAEPDNKDMRLLKIMITADHVKEGQASCGNLAFQVGRLDLSRLTPEEQNNLCDLIAEVCKNTTIPCR
jgi:tetratricopeptide (TPR) repeat protein